MKTASNKVLGLALAAVSLAFAQLSAVPTPSKDAGVKKPFTVKRGDCELTMGGKAKVEHFFQSNIDMLNRSIPNQNEYFKQTVDLTFDVAYGKEKYGYTAAEFFLDLRHKGVWGKALSYADKDNGAISPNSVRLSDSVFGAHAHTSGKPLIWYKDAWLQFSWNAVFGLETDKIHTFKAGWFPFEMGRGIALGGVYGLNKENLGLYSYAEDKAAPGLLLHGDLIKDRLTYDLYFSRFEERSKSLSDTVASVKRHRVDLAPSGHIWRGINKDDDLFAGRVQWNPCKNHETFGTVMVEPYAFYNAASDQTVEIAPDARTTWGSYGVMLEHEVNGFEWGFETAFNYGKQHLFNIDRNTTELKRDANGFIIERYTHIVDGTDSKVPVTANSQKAAAVILANQSYTTNVAIPGYPTYFSKTGRYRPAFDNHFGGWMAVADMGYTFEKLDLKVALGYSYASGDVDPTIDERNKTFSGFVGLHEYYTGKRVRSVIMLDERLTRRPQAISAGQLDPKAGDFTFTDLQTVGISATWTPKCFIKDLSINPNLIGFWKAKPGYAFVATPTHQKHYGVGSLTEKAASYMGTEFNVCTKFSMLKDLNFFANAAVFAPGAYYNSVKGVSVDARLFSDIEDDPRNDIKDALNFRLGSDTAFHLNMGIEFKF